MKPLLLLALPLLAACSGAVLTQAPETDGGGVVDSGKHSYCPTAVPASESACSPDGFECEYGAGGAPQCNTVATCTAGKWSVTSPAPGACGLPSSKCPADYKSVPVGQACPGAYPSVCTYPEGNCGCETGMGGPVPADAGGAAKWSCDAPQTGCPSPRPKLGTPCVTENQECDYSTCVLPTGAAFVCKQGTWHQQFFACAQ